MGFPLNRINQLLCVLPVKVELINPIPISNLHENECGNIEADVLSKAVRLQRKRWRTAAQRVCQGLTKMSLQQRKSVQTEIEISIL